jgi:hypothetical protein
MASHRGNPVKVILDCTALHSNMILSIPLILIAPITGYLPGCHLMPLYCPSVMRSYPPAVTYFEYVAEVFPLINEKFRAPVTTSLAPSIPVGLLEGRSGVDMEADSVTGIEAERESARERKRSGVVIPEYGVFDIVVEGDEGVRDVYRNMMALLPPPKVHCGRTYCTCL